MEAQSNHRINGFSIFTLIVFIAVSEYNTIVSYLYDISLDYY
jgi:hypothetical protein